MRSSRPLATAALLTGLLASLVLTGCGSRGAPSVSATPIAPAGPAPSSASSGSTDGAGAADAGAAPSGATGSGAASSGAASSGAAGSGAAAVGNQPDSSAEAVATAHAFLRRQVGMGALVASPLRRTGANTAEVGFRPELGEGGRPMPSTAPTTVVSLQRGSGGWWVVGTRSASIQLGSPLAWSRIASPLTVSGRASAFEGTVQVAVAEELRDGRLRRLGAGVVTGSGSAQLGPFSGRIAFRESSAEVGWLVLTTESAADGGILEATAMRVRFATPAPRIVSVQTTPRLTALSAFALDLPPGSGKVVVRVEAPHATRVRLLLTPTGTGTASLARLLDEDADGRDGFTVTWRYADQPLLGYLTVRAIGPGGTAEKQIGVHHPDPAA
jgi:hypothetical protein